MLFPPRRLIHYRFIMPKLPLIDSKFYELEQTERRKEEDRTLMMPRSQSEWLTISPLSGMKLLSG